MKLTKNVMVQFGLVLGLSLTALSQLGFEPDMIVYLLACLLLAGLTCLMVAPWSRMLILVLACALSFWQPNFSYFLPPLLLASFSPLSRDSLLLYSQLGLTLLTIGWADLPWPSRLFLGVLSLLAFFLHWQNGQNHTLRRRYTALTDDSWEKEANLAQQNNHLLLAQEELLTLKVSQERNRIAHDIHDNVGHLLSSAIIQLGALEALNHDPHLAPHFEHLQATIHQGMDSIRWSVHNLHDDSQTLAQALAALQRDFQFCALEINGTPFAHLTPASTKVLLLALKEAFSNIMKHSNATLVRLDFAELPAFYRLTIHDNGTLATESSGQGIGLSAMAERLATIGGQLHQLQNEQGFQLNLILPKEEQ